MSFLLEGFGEALTRKLQELESELPLGYVLEYATFQPDLVEAAIDDFAITGETDAFGVVTVWWRPAGCCSWCWIPGLRRMARLSPWKPCRDNGYSPVRSKPEMQQRLTAGSIVVT